MLSYRAYGSVHLLRACSRLRRSSDYALAPSLTLTRDYTVTGTKSIRTSEARPNATDPFPTDASTYRRDGFKLYGQADGERQVRCENWHSSDNDHRLAIVKIQGSTKANSIFSGTLEALTHAFRDVASEPGIRCVVVTGDASNFCAGMNITELQSLHDPEQARLMITKVYDACQAIREIDVPTIAQIYGACFGAGLELAASCDFRYATSRTIFAMPEVQLGIPSVVHARLLANIIGWQKTRDLLLTGRTIDVQEAHECGLVDEVFPRIRKLHSHVIGMAGIFAKNGPSAMQSQKRLIRHWEENDLDSGVKAGIDAFAEMYSNGADEPRAYMANYLLEKARDSQARKKLQAGTSITDKAVSDSKDGTS